MERLNSVAFGALVIAYALGPLATQIVTPAVPFVHLDLGVTMATAQMLVSVAFAAIALATLVYGPLSDHYGRRPVILIGTTLFCAGSLVAMLAPTVSWLIAGRALQAAGSAAALSLARTVVHDVYGRRRSGQVLAQLTTVMILVPMLAPLLGGTLLDRVGWRAVFGVCLVVGVAALSLLLVCLPETRPAPDRSLRLRRAVADYVALLADRGYRAPAFNFAWTMAAVFATQAAIPYLVVEVLHDTAVRYGAWFGVGCLFYVAGNQFTARWGGRFTPRGLMLWSGIGGGAAALIGFAATHVFHLSTTLLFLPTIGLYFFAAIGIAPVQAEAVAAQPQRSGAASGLLTALQMTVGAVAVQVVGYSHDGTARPMFVGLVICTGAALLSLRGPQRNPAAPARVGMAVRGDAAP
jgi:DHA1 family bicyclomycin/chloramphenicol resistance-like MFS transporter